MNLNWLIDNNFSNSNAFKRIVQIRILNGEHVSFVWTTTCSQGLFVWYNLDIRFQYVISVHLWAWASIPWYAFAGAEMNMPKKKCELYVNFSIPFLFFYLVFIFSFVLHNGIFFLWLICDSVVIRLAILRVFLGWYLLFMFRFFFGEKKYKLLLMCVTSVNCKWGCLV